MATSAAIVPPAERAAAVASPADRADRARQRAEARRQRILARGAERLDAVNGSTPGSRRAAAGDADPLPADGAGGGAAAEPPRSDGGARRAAAMRKRRCQAKSKPREDAAGANGEGGGGAKGGDGQAAAKEDAEVAVVEGEASPSVVKGEASPSIKSKELELTAAATPHETADKGGEGDKNNKEDKDDKVTEETEKEAAAPKKYKGVARMRRQLIKEKKAQRLKDISEAEILTSKATASDLEREIAAEMATMDFTMTMMRRGGMGTLGAKSNFSTAALKGGFLAKGKKWYAMLLPPAKMLPRLATLLLLFFAGLDLGSQPHPSANTRAGGVAPLGVAGNGVAATREGLIHHVESSFTKPWEYGMGGKAAYMMGMAPTSPPTAMPTAFDGEMVCINNIDEAECSAAAEKTAAKEQGMKKDKGRKKKILRKVQLMEDEFDTSRTRPRGVTRDSEFHDAPPLTGDPRNIDPLLKVDLDLLLENARLPYAVERCAALAIGFHRAWVYYLVQLPASVATSAARFPGRAARGGRAHPPWLLGVALAIRLVVKIVLGGVAPDRSKTDSAGAEGEEEGVAGKKQDVLEKGIDFAKNYVSSAFPKTVLVLGTLIEMMRVDMYVMLCGVLIGLVLPSVKEDYLAPLGKSLRVVARPVLGEGEL